MPPERHNFPHDPAENKRAGVQQPRATFSRRTILLITCSILVALAIMSTGTAAWWQWDKGRQPQVDDVLDDMNTAVADAVVAAGADAAVTVSPVVPAAQCRSGLHQGNLFTGRADLYTDPGNEDTLITAIEQRLPARYSVTRGAAVAGIRPLQADTNRSVTLAVRRLSPGWLTVTARSRCSLGTAAPPSAPAESAEATTALTTLLRHIGTTPASATEQRVRCANGDIITVAAVSNLTDTTQLGDRLDALIPSNARRFVSGESNRVTYRDAKTSVVVAATDDGTAITAQITTTC